MTRTHGRESAPHEEPAPTATAISTPEIDADAIDLGYLGAYRLDAVLGRGGMGEVFSAWDERLRRRVAIKRILPKAEPNPRARSRFRLEARAVARLNHPAIVQIYDLLELETGDCIVMEYVEGRGLRELILADELDLDTTLRLAAEIAWGLGEAHGKGLVHRDLKADNIRVSSTGQARVLDFGLARLSPIEANDDGVPSEQQDDSVSSEPVDLTGSHVLVGTIHAMSPEQASGQAVDHRSDLFALGSLLYQMLTGRTAFGRGSVGATLRSIIAEQPKPLGHFRTDLPPALVALVDELLAKLPEHRPESALVVADALECMRAGMLPDTLVNRRAEGARRERGGASDQAAVSTFDATAADDPWGSEITGSRPQTVVRVLLQVSLIDTRRFAERLGDAKAAEVFRRHNRVARDLLERFQGLEVDRPNGFLFLFERPIDAVGCALAYHHALVRITHELSEIPDGLGLEARIGVHLGEVVLRHNSARDIARGASPLEVEGAAKSTVGQIASLAGPRQVLLTRGIFDLARKAARAEQSWDDSLIWLAHGEYAVDGSDEPLEVFEVGVEHFARLLPPADSGRAKRLVAMSDELLLGWRPAIGQSLPRRANWLLEQRIGEGAYGEVWTARHASGEIRVFKFCFESAWLLTLQQEVHCFRLIRDALGHRDDIARILDWNFEEPPFFLETEYAAEGHLVDWAESRGGLEAIPLATRVELVADVAEALAAAHSVGVLHKDVRPTNVLIRLVHNEKPRVRLTDFGVGPSTWRAPRRASEDDSASPSSGSIARDTAAFYRAPEVLEGRPTSIQADLYSLGVMLYQMVVGDFTRLVAPGWRRDVDDPLLIEDIAALVDGRSECRPQSGLSVAWNLRHLATRRAALAEASRARSAFETARRRRRLVAVLAGLAMVILLPVALFAWKAQRALEIAEYRRVQSEDLISFMVSDLREKLAPSTQLDILEEVDSKALEYFASVPAHELTDNEVSRRSAVLAQIGDVRMRRGDLAAALTAFHESLKLARELERRAPHDPERKLRLGNSHFWVGSVFWQRGQLDEALGAFRAYLGRARDAVALRPGSEEAKLEVAYGHGNVGRVLEAKGHIDDASIHYRDRLTIIRRLVDASPHRSDLQLELGSSHVMAGTAAEALGRPDEALHHFRTDLQIMRGLTARDPANTEWQERLLTAQNHVATALKRQGDINESLVHARAGAAIAGKLLASDESNTRWRYFLAVTEIDLSKLRRAQGQLAEAESHLETALSLLLRLTRQDPSKTRWQRMLAIARSQFGAIVALQGGRRTGLAEVEVACRVLQTMAERATDSAQTARALSECQLIRGRILWDLGAERPAREAWSAARDAISPWAAASNDAQYLSPLCRALLWLDEQAQAGEILDELRAQNSIDPLLREVLERRRRADGATQNERRHHE